MLSKYFLIRGYSCVCVKLTHIQSACPRHFDTLSICEHLENCVMVLEALMHYTALHASLKV